MNATILNVAIAGEHHPQVRRILDLNSWKIKSWADYASWKRHARWFVPQTYKNRLAQINASLGFDEA